MSEPATPRPWETRPSQIGQSVDADGVRGMTYEYKVGPAATHCGNEARIYAIDGKEPMAIHGAFRDENGEWNSTTWAKSGVILDDGHGYCIGVLNLVPPKRHIWIAMWFDMPGETRAYSLACKFKYDAEIVANLHGRECIGVFGPIDVEPKP